MPLTTVAYLKKDKIQLPDSLMQKIYDGYESMGIIFKGEDQKYLRKKNTKRSFWNRCRIDRVVFDVEEDLCSDEDVIADEKKYIHLFTMLGSDLFGKEYNPYPMYIKYEKLPEEGEYMLTARYLTRIASGFGGFALRKYKITDKMIEKWKK